MEVVVTGIGLLSALGSLEATWQRLCFGESAIRLYQPFQALAPGPLALIGSEPSALSLLLQAVVQLALKDAGLMAPLTNCGVVIGSSRSHQAQWEKLTQHPLVPREHWLDTLPHMPAIMAARQIQSQGPVLAPMAACATGLWAMAQGFELLQTGQCHQVLAGAVEAPITPLTLVGFEQMGALSHQGAYPFDRNRSGLVLGEGAAVLLMESLESAQQRSAQIYGRVLSFGLSADGCHVSAPDPTSVGAIAAVQQCLGRAQLLPESIGYIHAHGTATQLNDCYEAHVLQQVFPQGVPVSSTKGAIGHTLGASGALGASFCLMALREQTLPPCTGLQTPEFNLDLITTARSVSIQRALCLSFGFGGQNAVLALGTI